MDGSPNRPLLSRSSARESLCGYPARHFTLGNCPHPAQDDIIRNGAAFAAFSDWHFRRPLQAGEYLFDQSLDSREVFWKIAHGQIFVHIVTVPEGWTMYDIADELERQGICSRADFLAEARDTSLISRSRPAGAHPGRISFSLHVSVHAAHHLRTDRCNHGPRISASMAMWNRFSEPRNSRSGTHARTGRHAGFARRTRNARSADERPLVAGVFYNRLQRGDPLQCDPTVQYALLHGGTPVKTMSSRDDLRVDSPYNTYEHRGLPPGPIANPGEASLRAALAPAANRLSLFRRQQ